MRQTSVISMLLIAILAVSASSCVAGWGSGKSDCSRVGQVHVGSVQSVLISSPAACHQWRGLPGKCGMRTFVQLQFVVLRTLSIAAPVRTAGAILRPGGSLILVSSVGSPETDRGPPVS